ncbi:MAG: TonB-dependent receptor [Mangrovibacterium sp.]
MKKNLNPGLGINAGLLKMIRIMRITIFIVFISLSQIFATNSYSQQTKLSLDMENARVEAVIDQIEKNTEFVFLYNKDVIDVERRVSIEVKERSVNEVLDQVFANTDVTWSIRDRKIFLINNQSGFSGNQSSLQQNLSVSGRVTDYSGESLPGVTVVIKGSTQGTITNSEGRYFIANVSPDAILLFSFVGMKTEEIAVDGRTSINVQLEEEEIRVEEVVVIGYGVQRREAVTGSVASIGGNELREVASSNITQAMQGRLPGVEMTQTDTKPGAQMQIRIRGIRSLNTSNTSEQNNPLVVLDGIPFAGSLNDIDPNSIKSIDILKDASATAIYGSRGANGVILITTNRGRKGQQVKVSYNAYYGVKNAIKYPMMNGPELAKLREEAIRTADELTVINPTVTYPKYPASDDELANANTDWQKLLYRTGRVNSHDLSISKGSEDGNYTFGIGYFNDEAVIPTQGYERFTLRAAVDQEVGNYFRFGLTSNSSYGFSTGNQVGVGDALGSSPLASPYNEDGTLKRATWASQDVYKVWTKESVEAVKDLWLSETKSLGTYNNLYGEVKIPWIDGLKYRINIGLNYRQSQGGGFTGKGVTSATNPNELSSASVSNSLTTSWAVENLLSYDRIFADKHKVNAVALYSAEENRYNRSRFAVRDFPADHFQYYNLGFGEGERTIDINDQHYSVRGLVSWMGRVMYSYDDRYMLTATIRSDGASVLAPGHKWHTYPAMSAGWNIAEESFMKDISPIDMLKLRVGYGETSNQAINPYETLGRLNTRFYNFGDGEEGYATGYYISELPNVNLGWEFTETWNFGLDFGLFAGRLTGTIEYYKQHTKDILLSVSLPSTTGVSSYLENIGETENKGVELSLNGVILKNANGFTWEAGVNFYTNKNKLLALTSGQEKNEGNWWFVGHPINVIFDYKKVGLWQEEDPYLDILEPGGNAGMIKVEYTGEYNPDGTPVRAIGTDDRQVIEFDPDFQGGFNTRLAYKGLDLSVVGTFKSGGTLISTLYGNTSYLNLMNGRHNNVKVDDYWTPENRNAKYPRPGGASSADNPKYGSTRAYFDASYLKIRTISLGYNFSQGLIEKAGLSQLRLYATVQNPFVLFSPYHKESGMDPEPNSYGNQNQAVTDQIQERLPVVANNTPSTRNYLIGLSLTF